MGSKIMEVLEIEATNYSPHVRFDAESGQLLIEGVSRPENTVDFYRPLLEWLDVYIEQQLALEAAQRKATHLRLNMDYFNSISVKYLMGIILKCKRLYHEGKGLSVEWVYATGDSEAKDWGQDLAAIAGLPFTITER